MVLGRARRRTLVVDAAGQSNRVARGIGGLLGHDTRPPADFYAAGRDELAAYPTVQLRSGEVLGGDRHEAAFVLELADGSRESARRVLLATGMDYRFPALAGIPRDGVARCFTARSATAGRSATSHSACSTAVSRRCSAR